MLSGPILPVPRSSQLDRSDVSYTLWERSLQPNPVDLPWRSADRFDAADVRALVAGCRVVVAAGVRPELLKEIVTHLKPGARGYVYGPTSWESDPALTQSFARSRERLAVRLGDELPAEWIVVDGGRAGVVLFGAPGAAHRWAPSLEPPLARSLFEVSRVLWWRHARREGLPDAAGEFGFRPPLTSPFVDPGRSVSLPAGRFVFDQALPDPVPDAEFRVVPEGGAAARAAVVLMPPSSVSFDAARAVTAAGARVVWSDCGLPRMTVTRQRLVMDLVRGPIGVQLEWDTGVAVEVFHRLGKVCENPAWSFYNKRRLREISGPAWLEGASAAAPVEAERQVQLNEQTTALAEFEAQPLPKLPEPDPLTRRVLYEWKMTPERPPTGAAKALLIRQWTALDEWASRGVSVLQQGLDRLEGEERSTLTRLKRWLKGQDALARERQAIGEALVELGEQPPSQRSDAREAVARLTEEATKLKGLILRAHNERQAAEDRVEEERQRGEWQARVTDAERLLAERRAELAALEQDEARMDGALKAAEAAVSHRSAELRASRETQLTDALAKDERALAETRAALKRLDEAQRGEASKEERKALNAEIVALEPRIAATRRDLSTVSRWSPPQTELSKEITTVNTAREAKDGVRKRRALVVAETQRLEAAAREKLTLRAGPRLSAAAAPELGEAPTVPTEPPPELGELYEHQGQRFLAVSTWEQAQRARPVAARLRATLVASPTSNK